MPEVFRQYPLDRSGEEFETSRVDLNDIRLEFETEMSKYLLYRTLVENEDGSKTTYDTYRVPISKFDNILEIDIRTIHDASVLGYRSTVGPVVIQDEGKLLSGDQQARPAIYFFIEKTET
jgi:hypothetical protein